MSWTPTTRSSARATPLMTLMTGRITVTIAQTGVPSTRAARSGPASAMFFGIISPITTWRNTTIDSPIVKATGCRNDSGTCRACRTGSIR